MSAKSTPDRYGSVAIAIHWSSAIAIVVVFILGLTAANSASPATEVTLVRGHVGLAVLVLLLTLLRIVWWWLADRQPRPVASQPKWQQVVASLVHRLIYVVILLMAASGIGTVVLSGAGPAIIAGTALPDFATVPPFLVHELTSRLMLALLAAHIGAALYHQFVRRDRLLARMGVGGA